MYVLIFSLAYKDFNYYMLFVTLLFREDGELEDGEIDDEGIGIEEENKDTVEATEEKEKEKVKAKEKEEKLHRHSRKRYRKPKEKRRSKRRRRDRAKVKSMHDFKCNICLNLLSCCITGSSFCAAPLSLQ